VSKKEGSGFLDGLFFGSLVGGVVGILFAPHAGEETREYVKNRIDEFSDNSDQVVQELKDGSQKAINQTKEAVESGIDKLTYAISEAKKAAQQKHEELEKEQNIEEEGA